MFSFALLTEQFKRFGSMMVLSLLVYLLFVVMPIYNTNDPYQAAAAMIEVLSMRNPVMLVATLVVPFATVVVLFSYLFDDRMSIGLIGLADTRNRMFWTNMVAASIIMFVPLVLSCVALLVRVVEYPGDVLFIAAAFPHEIVLGESINSQLAVAAFGIRIILSFGFYFSVFLLAFSLSGNRLMAGILSLALPFTPVMFYRAIKLISVLYVVGYDSEKAPLPGEIAAYSNPIAWLWESASNAFVYVFGHPTIVAVPINPANITRFTNPITWYWNWGIERQLIHLLTYSAGMLAVFIVAYICIITRRAERVGESIVFRTVKHLALFFASATGMVALGGFLLDMASGRWFVYYGLILGFILSFCIALMVYERTFNIFNRIRLLTPHAIAMLLLYGSVHFISIIVMTNYVSHIPRPDEVSGVFTSSERRWEEGMPFVEDQGRINYVVGVHAQLLGRHHTWQQRFRHLQRMQSVTWQSVVSEGRHFDEEDGEYLFLAYRMADGEIIFRRYALSSDDVGVENHPQLYTVAEPPEYESPSSEYYSEYYQETPYYEYEVVEEPEPQLTPAPVAEAPHLVEYIRLRFLDIPMPGGNVLEFVVLDDRRIELLTELVHQNLEIDRMTDAGHHYTLDVFFSIKDAYGDMFENVTIFLVESDNVFDFMLEYYSGEADDEEAL